MCATLHKFSLHFSLIRYLFLLFTSSCVPLKSFDKTLSPPPPDYSQENCWAALPSKKDGADVVPHGSALKDEQATADADVFFVYPTIYSVGRKWNADVNNKKLNRLIDKTTIRHQASVFNCCGKIYVPRYRQAILWSYARLNGSGKKALAFAYKDVQTAFEFYLKHYHRGRPLIIASHSQGTQHAAQLLRDYFENDSLLRSKLIAAYLVGGPVKKNSFRNIPPCDSASQTGCFLAWNSRKRGMKRDKYFGDSLECVNPLTWKRDTIYASHRLNKGGVPFRMKRIDPGVADAQVAPLTSGLLWVNKKRKRGYIPMNGRKNYHVLDYNLFWLNIRENVSERINAYIRKNK